VIISRLSILKNGESVQRFLVKENARAPSLRIALFLAQGWDTTTLHPVAFLMPVPRTVNLASYSLCSGHFIRGRSIGSRERLVQEAQIDTQLGAVVGQMVQHPGAPNFVL
jgi:hypothetical protein